jgi:hypothetical protein
LWWLSFLLSSTFILLDNAKIVLFSEFLYQHRSQIMMERTTGGHLVVAIVCRIGHDYWHEYPK